MTQSQTQRLKIWPCFIQDVVVSQYEQSKCQILMLLHSPGDVWVTCMNKTPRLPPSWTECRGWVWRLKSIVNAPIIVRRWRQHVHTSSTSSTEGREKKGTDAILARYIPSFFTYRAMTVFSRHASSLKEAQKAGERRIHLPGLISRRFSNYVLRTPQWTLH